MVLTPAFTGGLAGAIVTLIGTWIKQYFENKKKKKQDTKALAAAIIQDLDGLLESFESLYADASDCVNKELEIKLRVFKYIEPTSFANRYLIKFSLGETDYRKLEAIPYTLRELRQSSETIILDPPDGVAKDHWDGVQAFLAELAEVREGLVRLS